MSKVFHAIPQPPVKYSGCPQSAQYQRLDGDGTQRHRGQRIRFDDVEVVAGADAWPGA